MKTLDFLSNKSALDFHFLAILMAIKHNAPALKEAFNGGSVGSPATLLCLPGQVRKEAAKADDACAGM